MLGVFILGLLSGLVLAAFSFFVWLCVILIRFWRDVLEERDWSK
jgi:hypothetical protein